MPLTWDIVLVCARRKIRKITDNKSEQEKLVNCNGQNQLVI